MRRREGEFNPKADADRSADGIALARGTGTIARSTWHRARGDEQNAVGWMRTHNMAKKTSGRKYGKKASDKVGKAMREMKRGKLKSGRSGKKVKNPKQAIAIGLSQARRAGGKVPRKKS
jgi:Family of unknown function (DUF6496)